MSSRAAFSPTSAVSNLQNGYVWRNASVLGGIVIGIIMLFVGGCEVTIFEQAGKLDAEKMKLRRFRLEEVEKATNNFSQDCLVGAGAFGNVYRGTFDMGETLAIKKSHSESYTTLEEFRNEVRLLSKVKHNNLVGLVGFCEETGKAIYEDEIILRDNYKNYSSALGPKAAKILVYEYVSNGSLLDYIKGWGEKSLTWRERVKIAIGAAKGIAHLHEGINPSIIHRDIKPSNILIGEGYVAKVSDFGLVRCGPVGDQSHVSSQVKGTPGYLDPAYCSTFHLTPFTDVYSFGVILLQLVTARPAVEQGQDREGNIADIVDTNLLLQGCNMEIMLKMGQIALRCVVKVPKERPSMTQVWEELEKALNSVDDLLVPKHPLEEDSLRLISILSVDGIGLERFHVDVDSLSFQSASLRCLETSISVDEDFSIRR
ncbi:hypothetical protein DH2020_014305 [Rehmannia glutinosa]|uniref:Protein kinase domain-containing protein n=1 Tax=Rehmannia glutinosa TaxID=99300 RepID=A0ABR0WWS3_REHGL